MTQLTRRSLLQLLGITSAALALPNAVVDRVEEPEDLAAPRNTRLEAFLRSRGIKPAHLARESGYSRQHLLRIRFGRMLPSLNCIASIVVATRRLTRECILPEGLFEAQVIRAAWHDVRFTDLHEEDRAYVRAAFGRRTLREFLAGVQA